jgi:hypothetical protein
LCEREGIRDLFPVWDARLRAQALHFQLWMPWSYVVDTSRHEALQTSRGAIQSARRRLQRRFRTGITSPSSLHPPNVRDPRHRATSCEGGDAQVLGVPENLP